MNRLLERFRPEGSRPAPGRRRPAADPGDARTTALPLVAVVGVLNVIGLMMVLSASNVAALRDYGSSWFFFTRQAIWVAVGIVVMVVCARTDYRRWRALGLPLVGISAVLLLLVLIPGVGISVHGSSRWLGAGFIRMQPSELAKLAVLLFAADLLARRRDKGDLSSPLKPVLVVVGLIAALVMKQPDMGTTLAIGTIVMALLFLVGVPLRTMVGLVAAAAGAAFVVGMVEPYRRARLMSFMDPFADGQNSGYQVVQSLVGLGSGQLTGVGLGASRAKWGFLPNAHTDFIFAVIGEEMGLLGAVVVVALFAAFAVIGVRTALRCPDTFGMLLAGGVTAWLVGQAIINISTVCGLLPVTGVPLPFVSLGGSSTVIAMAAVGLMVSVARRSGPARP